MNYHFIAIGGSAMHNLAIALHKKGENITGSDDEIFEPSRSRLKKLGLLPDKEGWFPDKLNKNIDAVVLGMHAKKDNPELAKAKELGLKIYSYPEFLYKQTQNKNRVVIGGSHGKTSTTAMILHVLKYYKQKFDYMVGAQLDGFETMVGFSDEAEVAVFEGDEYLTSAIDPRPKFHVYKPHIGLITGIAWDHINVFPTMENYIEQFEIFVNQIEDGGTLIYFDGDENLKKIVDSCTRNINFVAYTTHNHFIAEGLTYLVSDFGDVPLCVFGKHNLQNLSGAMQVCLSLGISEKQFYEAIKSFQGASKRLQLLGENEKMKIFQDFAHSPSKLKATVDAIKEQYPDKEIVACMELHTYSSLNKKFLTEYKGCMNKADKALVFYSEHAIELKKLEKFDKNIILESFDKEELVVFDDEKKLKNELFFMEYKNSILLLLSSGNFNGLNLKELASDILARQIN